MQDDLFFRLTVMILFVGARYVRWNVRHDIGWDVSWPAMKKHPLDTTVLISLSLFWLTAALVYMVVPQFVARFGVPIPTWIRCCAIAVALGSLALLWWSDRCLGKNLSVTLRIREGHTLVTEGPYRLVRHPIYTSTLLYSAAVATVTANYVLGAMFLLPMVSLVVVRLGREERMMLEEFGDEYRDYMQRSGRLLPRLWR